LASPRGPIFSRCSWPSVQHHRIHDTPSRPKMPLTLGADACVRFAFAVSGVIVACVRSASILPPRPRVCGLSCPHDLRHCHAILTSESQRTRGFPISASTATFNAGIAS